MEVESPAAAAATDDDADAATCDGAATGWGASHLNHQRLRAGNDNNVTCTVTHGYSSTGLHVYT